MKINKIIRSKADAKALIKELRKWIDDHKDIRPFTKDDFEWVDLGLPSGTLWAVRPTEETYNRDDADYLFGEGLLPNADQAEELHDLGKKYKYDQHDLLTETQISCIFLL